MGIQSYSSYGHTAVLFIWAYNRTIHIGIQPYSSYRYGQCHTIFSSCPAYNNLAYKNGHFVRIHYSCNTVTTRPNSSKKENVQKHAFLELASEVSPFWVCFGFLFPLLVTTSIAKGPTMHDYNIADCESIETVHTMHAHRTHSTPNPAAARFYENNPD